jgi:hypothetical protein
MTYFTENDPSLVDYAKNYTTSPQELLTYIEYAIVPGRVLYTPSLINGSTFQTVEGRNVSITTVNGSTYVNDARIVRKDVLVGNGVLHVIDKVSLLLHLWLRITWLNCVLLLSDLKCKPPRCKTYIRHYCFGLQTFIGRFINRGKGWLRRWNYTCCAGLGRRRTILLQEATSYSRLPGV